MKHMLKTIPGHYEMYFLHKQKHHEYIFYKVLNGRDGRYHWEIVLTFSQVNHVLTMIPYPTSLWYSVGRSLDPWRNKWANVQGIKDIYITCGGVDSFTKY